MYFIKIYNVLIEFIQISNEQGENLTQIVLNLIKELIGFNVNVNILEQKIKLLRMNKQRTEFLKNKINDNLYELRKILFDDKLSCTKIQQFNWRYFYLIIRNLHRYQIQLSSKTQKSLLNPNIVLHLKLKHPSDQQQQQSIDYVMNSDMGNLKNLQYQLNQALKIHGNTKYKVPRNSSV